MARTSLGVIAIASLWIGCTAKASVKSSEKPRAEEAPSAWEGSSGAAPAASAPSTTSTAATSPTPPASAAPAASAPPAAARPGCTLVCNVANKGRVAAADEARLTASLAEVTNDLHRCVPGPAPSMTLRFDSSGMLTGFGVDHAGDEDGSGSACIDSINRRMPAVTYPGPATVRCAERCAR